MRRRVSPSLPDGLTFLWIGLTRAQRPLISPVYRSPRGCPDCPVVPPCMPAPPLMPLGCMRVPPPARVDGLAP
jgi:hypothetical protein